MKLLTIDILDTTLIRKCGEPYIIFHLLAHKLFPNDRRLRDTFCQWRLKPKPKESKLTDIYSNECIPAELKSKYTAEHLMKEEIEMEYRNMTSYPMIREFIRKMRDEGWTVKFVSDMYLGNDFFYAKLQDEGILQADDEVIVSCEWGARKDDGTLYERLREKYTPKEWRHYGDNIHSDVRMARNKGVKAKLISCPYLDVEIAMADKSNTLPEAWQSAYLAGICRFARLKMQDSPFARMAADYVVPILLPFVAHLAADIRSQGIDTIHFLSRDGYIMHEMMRNMPQESIHLKYSRISRKAITGAFMHVCSANEFCKIYENPEIRRMRICDIMLKYTGLDTDEIERITGIKTDGYAVSDNKIWQSYVKDIFASQRLIEIIRRMTEDEYRTTVTYLIAQGIFRKNTAIADIGWLGHTRMMLNAIARSCGKEMPIFYYFCVTDNVLGSEYGSYLTYHTENRYPIISHIPALESYFCASPHLTTSHYEFYPDGNVYPVECGGKHNDNTQILTANTEIANMMIQCLSDSGAIHIISSSVLDRWGHTSLQAFSEYKYPIDYNVFTQAEGISGETLARKLTWRDFPFAGRTSDFKFADYAVSIGYTPAKLLWRTRLFAIKFIGRFISMYYLISRQLKH